MDQERRLSTFEKIVDSENLFYAFRKARKGKGRTGPVSRFDFHCDTFLWELQKELAEKTYLPGKYVSFRIRYPKPRLITAAPFRDRVVHHALCAVIAPLFESRFLPCSFANRPGFGTHRAFRSARRSCREYTYVLKCDVKRFFPSIDHEILKRMVSDVVGDEDTLGLIDTLIDAESGCESYDNQTGSMPLFDSLRRRGIPIGNLTSQFFANIYLNGLDHFVVEALECAPYIRYVDDFLLFGASKQALGRFREAIREYLRSIRLVLHEKKQEIFPVRNGVDFLGYRITPRGVRVRTSNVRTFQKRTKARIAHYRQGKLPLEKISEGVRSWIAHARHADSYRLREVILNRIVVEGGGPLSDGPWRGVEQYQREQLPVRVSQQQQSEQPQQQHRVPRGAPLQALVPGS